MKNMQPISRALRQDRELERLRQFCAWCIESDHVAGRQHDSWLTFPLCQKHHSEVTENRRRADVSMRYESNPVRRVALALKATSVFQHMLGDAMWRWAKLLDESQESCVHSKAKMSER